MWGRRRRRRRKRTNILRTLNWGVSKKERSSNHCISLWPKQSRSVFPSGKFSFSLFLTAVAEVHEETGYSVKVNDLVKLKTFKSGVGTAASTQTIYYVEVRQIRDGPRGAI